MTGRLNRSSSRSRNRGATVYAFALAALVLCAACQSSGVRNESEARGIIVINAPATGEVRRVLVREGMTINEGTPIVEIAVRTEAPSATPSQTEDPQARARRTIGATQGEIEAARAEVVRTEVEMQRLTPLVASGEAPQGQLDGARADYERAQQRFQRAQSASQNAQSGLVAARQQSQNSARTSVAPSEQIVVASASSAGTVSAVSARVGDRVNAGQPLATLRAGER